MSLFTFTVDFEIQDAFILYAKLADSGGIDIEGYEKAFYLELRRNIAKSLCTKSIECKKANIKGQLQRRHRRLVKMLLMSVLTPIY